MAMKRKLKAGLLAAAAFAVLALPRPMQAAGETEQEDELLSIDDNTKSYRDY